MTQTNFKTILNVTAQGVVTGDYWKAISDFEQSQAVKRERICEEQRIDDLKRAYFVPGAPKPSAAEPKEEKQQKTLSTFRDDYQSTVFAAGSFFTASR